MTVPDQPASTAQTTAQLLAGGFTRAGAWHPDEVSGSISLKRDQPLSREPGVYAYAVGGIVRYVGSAQRGLHSRLRHYEIAKTLRIVHRIQQEISLLLLKGGEVEVSTIVPPPIIVNGLPVDMVLGLEEGLTRS